ncbi:ankyrin repeat-containing domain protein [Xylariaceae sp. FL0255]|nr:ankyrin repeat-containing domain protein [Xylariaceae sp. FL0255]
MALSSDQAGGRAKPGKEVPSKNPPNLRQLAKEGDAIAVNEYLHTWGFSEDLLEEAMLMACIYGNLNVVKTLVGAGAKPDNRSALNYAIEAGQLQTIQYLVENCGDKSSYLNGSDPLTIHTALAIAAFSGNLEVVKYLVESGADLSLEPNDKSYSPQHFACLSSKDNQDIVEYLINSKKEVLLESRTKQGQNTCLHLAAATDNARIARWLLDNGADTSVLNDQGHTPWVLAHLNQSVSVMGLLTLKEIMGKGMRTSVSTCLVNPHRWYHHLNWGGHASINLIEYHPQEEAKLTLVYSIRFTLLFNILNASSILNSRPIDGRFKTKFNEISFFETTRMLSPMSFVMRRALSSLSRMIQT